MLFRSEGPARHRGFEIVLPADAPECWEAEYNSQHWYLEAVADIPLRRDEISRIELLVSDPSQ